MLNKKKAKHLVLYRYFDLRCLRLHGTTNVDEFFITVHSLLIRRD